MEPLVSICIPVYNGASYLNACLDSIFAQTFTNYELLIVDDGSSDESITLLSEAQKRFPKLRVHHNEKNLGLVGNWNRCLELAQGTWIKFVFQDDLLAPDCLSQLMMAAADSQALIVCQRHFLIEEDAPEDLRQYFTKEVLTLEKIYNGQVPGFIPARQIAQLAVRYITRNFIGEPTTVLFKRALVSRLGNFDPNLAQICDLEYWLRIATHYGLKYVPEPLCTFRVHGSSATTSNTRGKQFISLFSDPTILASRLINAEVFNPFRHAISYLQSRKLHTYFGLKRYEAGMFLKANPEEASSRGALLLQKNTAFRPGETSSFWTQLVFRVVYWKRKRSKG